MKENPPSTASRSTAAGAGQPATNPVKSTRRAFLGAAAAAPALPALLGKGPEILVRRSQDPVAISSSNGLEAVRLAVLAMGQGKAPVEAAVHGVNVVEADPKDMSVGYGGLPNAEGVVELDSCCMDGPTHLAGAVAALRNIKHPSQVALRVLRRTDHVLLVGRGALRFARSHGFHEENLLTEAARKRWLAWKEKLSSNDDWLEPGENQIGEVHVPGKKEERLPGTIHLSARNAAGDFGACTTTSGLSYKIPGRVGDSPLIGCGLYLDNDVGSAGSTGRGEAAILSNGASAVVEFLRQGKAPVDACLATLERVAQQTKIARLKKPDGRPNFQLNFYCIGKDGRFGAASMYPSRFAICTAAGPERRSTAALYER